MLLRYLSSVPLPFSPLPDAEFRMQGGLELATQYLAGEDSSLAGACELVALSTAAAQEEQLLIEDLSALLEVPLTDTSLLALLSQCAEIANVNDAASEQPTGDAEATIMQHIAAGEPLVNITNVVFLNRGARSRSRQLLAAGRSKGRGGDASGGILQAAAVSDQGWTVNDLPVQFAPVRGTVLQPRLLGRGNELLGGLALTQTRSSHSSRKCSSRFSSLVSDCYRQQTASGNKASVNGLRPFGLDPAFNPRSGLFSADAAQNEEQYYNKSTGSAELSSDGFPVAFFPRDVKGKPTFIVVFPVRTSSPAPCISKFVSSGFPISRVQGTCTIE